MEELWKKETMKNLWQKKVLTTSFRQPSCRMLYKYNFLLHENKGHSETLSEWPLFIANIYFTGFSVFSSCPFLEFVLGLLYFL